jgi:3-hydroxyisobutyrate dehydrogenase
MTAQGTKIGFIGTGVMGASMAGHLMKAGAALTVYNRTKAKADALLAAGAVWAASPAEAARGMRIVITMVGYPADVEDVYLGPQGILAAAEPGTIFIDTTTSDPALAVRIAAAAEEKGLKALDAPVSGGDIGARNATLTIMAGGDEAAFERVKPILDCMGKTVIRQGGPGAGQHTKMANQITVSGNLLASIEGILYAESAGLEPLRVLESIGGGSAQSWQLANMVPRMLKGDFEPGFYSKHFLKDLRIALNSARSMGINLPALAMAESFFARMGDEGFAEKGTQALYLMYKRGLI